MFSGVAHRLILRLKELAVIAIGSIANHLGGERSDIVGWRQAFHTCHHYNVCFGMMKMEWDELCGVVWCDGVL